MRQRNIAIPATLAMLLMSFAPAAKAAPEDCGDVNPPLTVVADCAAFADSLDDSAVAYADEVRVSVEHWRNFEVPAWREATLGYAARHGANVTSYLDTQSRIVVEYVHESSVHPTFEVLEFVVGDGIPYLRFVQSQQQAWAEDASARVELFALAELDKVESYGHVATDEAREHSLTLLVWTACFLLTPSCDFPPPQGAEVDAWVRCGLGCDLPLLTAPPEPGQTPEVRVPIGPGHPEWDEPPHAPHFHIEEIQPSDDHPTDPGEAPMLNGPGVPMPGFLPAPYP